jgi:hypothetical protein
MWNFLSVVICGVDHTLSHFEDFLPVCAGIGRITLSAPAAVMRADERLHHLYLVRQNK